MQKSLRAAQGVPLPYNLSHTYAWIISIRRAEDVKTKNILQKEINVLEEITAYRS